MVRKLVAVVLLLVPFSSGSAVTHVMSATVHLCGCDEKMCRCPHHNQRRSGPKCHEADGASITNCASEEEPVLATTPFLFSQPTPSPRLIAEELQPAPSILPSTYFEDINPPPPRTSLA